MTDSTQQARAASIPDAAVEAAANEWGTDYWGDVLSEPSEEHARKVVASDVGVNLYSRSPGGQWVVTRG